MRVAALYDIHGNLAALEAVLAQVKAWAPDRILVGGDVALGPMPRETLELLFSLGDRLTFVRGNCDREMVSALAGTMTPGFGWGARTHWAAKRCTPAQMALLASWPTSVELAIDGLGPVLFCHGSPRSDDEIVTRVTPHHRLEAALGGAKQRVIISGHTHVQDDRVALGRRWVNPGSVGMPYSEQLGAHWATFGPDVTLRRTPYDVERTIADTRASGFPDPDEFVEKYLRRPPDPAEATARFEKMAEAAPAR